jgi:uncharacterized membrane protein YuzA (DUF378 family)
MFAIGLCKKRIQQWFDINDGETSYIVYPLIGLCAIVVFIFLMMVLQIKTN